MLMASKSYNKNIRKSSPVRKYAVLQAINHLHRTTPSQQTISNLVRMGKKGTIPLTMEGQLLIILLIFLLEIAVDFKTGDQVL